MVFPRMEPVRFAVIGGSGFVGRLITDEARGRGNVVEVMSRSDCDLYDAYSLARHLEAIGPDAVINAAGYTGRPNVDACESHKAECLRANAVLPGVIASACERLGLPWGHVSSGCIFSGSPPDGEEFTESHEPNFTFRWRPCSFYSGTKALGEEILQQASQCYIWRIRIPFSHHDSSKNYLSKLMRYDRLLEVTNSLSDIHEFVAAALDCFDKRVPFGTYHLTNPGAVSTTEVVSMIRQSGIMDRDVRFFDSEDEFMKLAARAPRSNCILSSQKALDAGLTLSPIREALRRALASWIPEQDERLRLAA